MTEHDNENDNAAPGWDAIDAALASLYADQTPKHYGTIISARLGGDDPLDGISAYRRTTPRPHWHFVTYGFSELYAKESNDPAYSGFGFELTFRLADDDRDAEPPTWALNFLQNLARYVFRTGNVFLAGHHMHLNGPIALEHDTGIVAIAFVEDPELPAIDTPHGRVEFLQIVGLTEDELQALKRWSSSQALEAMAPALPLFVTDLHRASLLNDPAIAQALEAGSAREGASTGRIYTDRLAWSRRKRLLRGTQTVVTIGARQVEELTALLPLRLPFGKEFELIRGDVVVAFEPADAAGVGEDGERLTVSLTADACRALAATLRPKAGEYTVSGVDGLVFEVVPTEIRDAEGKVVQTIG